MMRQTARGLLAPIAALAVLVLSVQSAPAQDYPSKPIKIAVPVAPGAATDALARLFADYVAGRSGQQVVVENRSGASGVVGMEAVARSNPDGYTLGVVNAGDLVVTPFLYKSLTFDPLMDLTPVAILAGAPQVLAVNAQVPARTLAEFIAYAKANPGKINYGSAGAGSLTHIGARLLAHLVGLDLVHVPYRGVAPAVTDLIGGRIQMMHTAIPAIVAHMRAGTVRVLAVAAPERWTDHLPNVPSSKEAGLPDYDMDVWFGVVAPRATPATAVRQLNLYARNMVADPVIRKRIVDGFLRPVSTTVDESQVLVARDAAKMERIIRETGVTLQ